MKTKRTYTSVCSICEGAITTANAVSAWTHLNRADWVDNPHNPKPELRFAIDATCPGCDFPEIGFAPDRGKFVCSRCGHTTDTRPPS